MMNALTLHENNIAKNGSFPGTASSPRTANRRETDRFSGKIKADGFESLPNGVARQ